jgi:hypothetical protein
MSLTLQKTVMDPTADDIAPAVVDCVIQYNLFYDHPPDVYFIKTETCNGLNTNQLIFQPIFLVCLWLCSPLIVARQQRLFSMRPFL